MLWYSVGVLVAAALLGLLPAQLDAYVVAGTAAGCHHNGTWYADKSVVPTIEQCLNCQCNKRSLVCRLKVCPEMPMPPPRGCVVVQKKHSCCPYLSCARLDVYYKIPTKRRIIAYLDHYERESIDRVVNENMLQRRSDDSELDMQVCVKNGTVYKSGSAMSSSNLCTYCYCIGGNEKCVKPKCMLPVEGCKPIFVDSTCCPVRYDCNPKPAGKSSQEVRYRKNANKHFLRMSQRLQRNRGCTVGNQFFAEGQKMKSDPHKPCDICFCIRGNRRCAPKKCSPPLKNCIPVVPKGQCCPSSYDCGNQRDYRRQNSRQFNLFSLLFGDELNETQHSTEIPLLYPHDRHPPEPEAFVESNSNNWQLESPATTERSLFDTIRQGLEFIDGNNNHMLNENADLVQLAAESVPQVQKAPEPDHHMSPLPLLYEPSPATEVSFLDLLLGPGAQVKQVNKLPAEGVNEHTPNGSSSLSWMDILLGPDDEEESTPNPMPISQSVAQANTSDNIQQEVTSIDRIGEDFDAISGNGNGEIVVGEQAANAVQSTTLGPRIDGVDSLNTEAATTMRTRQSITHSSPAEMLVNTSTTKSSILASTPVPVTSSLPTLPTQKQTPKTNVDTQEILENTDSLPHHQLQGHSSTDEATVPPPPPSPTTSTSTTISTTMATRKPAGLLSAFLDGFTEVLIAEGVVNKTQLSQSVMLAEKAPEQTKEASTSPSPPSFKPLPNDKPHIRINSKIANLTAPPPIVPVKHLENLTSTLPLPLSTVIGLADKPLRLPALLQTTPTPTPTTKTPTTTTTSRKPVSSTTTARTTTTAPTRTTTIASSTTRRTTTSSPALIIRTNPTILDIEPIDSSVEPTLPPSLPNLKIIPFLPTDAVKVDRLKPMPFDFYRTKQQAQPPKIDYDLYDESKLYPSITERFPSYPDLEDASKAEYIYKFKVEAGPTAALPALASKLDGSASAFVKYDFAEDGSAMSSFSPPARTEGGFIPKDPPMLDYDTLNESQHNYQVTKHIIDITTSLPIKPIEITTPDPFRDVIRTEPPPDLMSLIEDKQKVLVSQEKQPMEGYSNQSLMQIPIDAKNTSSATSSQVNDVTKAAAFESLLEILLKDENLALKANASSVVKNSTSSMGGTMNTTTVPLFKLLPQDTIQNLPTTLPNISATTARTQTQARLPANGKPVRSKTNSTALAGHSTRPKTKPKSPSRGSAANKTASSQFAKGNKTRHGGSSSHHRVMSTKLPSTAATHQKRPKTPVPMPALPTTTTTTTAPAPPTAATPTTRPTATTAPTALDTRTSSSSDGIGSIPTATNPFVMSPFDKLPFMDASFEVKPAALLESDLNTTIHYKTSSHQTSATDPATNSPPKQQKPPHLSPIFTTKTTTTTRAPLSISSSIQHSAMTGNNNFIDPTGMLKLAGCNIYGRMYRVGRIIVELSTPCLECRCTEVGVKCGALDC